MQEYFLEGEFVKLEIRDGLEDWNHPAQYQHAKADEAGVFV